MEGLFALFLNTLKNKTPFIRSILVLAFLSLLPLGAQAHEVYVLSHDEIQNDLHTPGFSLLQVALADIGHFTFWAFIAVLVIVSVFFISISRSLERLCDPFLAKLPGYAPVVSRVTIGISFIAAAHYGALFGPELPFAATFGAMGALFVTALLWVIGIMITVGFYARVAAAAGLVLFGIHIATYGLYMFTYTNYLGEIIMLLVLGAHRIAFHHEGHDRTRAPKAFIRFKKSFTPHAFLVLRVAFGASLIYASAYAKIFHNQLALAVASQPLAGHMTGLASVFGFTPEFLVLGAAIVEILIGLFFIFGIEIRFTSLFLIFWLSLSLWYFGETVWPHIILVGIPIAFIFYGYDKYSLEGYFFKRNGREPVL